MIKNIIFDFGGVLLTEDNTWLFSDETKNLLNILDESKLVVGWQSAWPDARDGKTDEDEFFTTFLKGAIEKKDDNLIAGLKKIYRNNTDTFTAFSILKLLKNKYRLFGLPNITKDWLKYKIDRFDLNEYLELVVSSCGEGIAKPNKEIFLSLINKAQIEPKETLFVDNMEKNIVPAKELGFETHLYTDLENLKKSMSELGINFNKI